MDVLSPKDPSPPIIQPFHCLRPELEFLPNDWTGSVPYAGCIIQNTAVWQLCLTITYDYVYVQGLYDKNLETRHEAVCGHRDSREIVNTRMFGYLPVVTYKCLK